LALFSKRIASPKPSGAPRNTALLVTIVTGILGAFIVVYLIGLMSRQVTVVVPSTTIPRFSIINAGELETVKIHVTDLLPGAVTDPNALVDKVAAYDLVQGEQIMANEVIPNNGHSSLAYAIGDNPGMRATAIPVSAVTSLGGPPAIEAGDYVDLVAAGNSGALDLQDIQVLGWIQTGSGGGLGGSSKNTDGIIVDVPAAYEQQITDAAQNGKLQIFLRPYDAGRGEPTFVSGSGGGQPSQQPGGSSAGQGTGGTGQTSGQGQPQGAGQSSQSGQGAGPLFSQPSGGQGAPVRIPSGQ